jgi:hypothetical protein
MAPSPGRNSSAINTLGLVENESISSDPTEDLLLIAGCIIDGIALLIILIVWSKRHDAGVQKALASRTYTLLLFSMAA